MFVSNVPERDVLYVYERGYVDDGLEPERKLELCGHVSLMLSIDGKECVGFIFGGLSEFDFEAPENAAVWSGPRFDVPAFGIERGTIGLIGATARMVLGTLRTPDRVLFDAAVSAPDPASALPLWEECLAEGNELARYALGYTLLAARPAPRGPRAAQALFGTRAAQRLGLVLPRSGLRTARGLGRRGVRLPPGARGHRQRLVRHRRRGTPRRAARAPRLARDCPLAEIPLRWAYERRSRD